jgi:alpha-glucosidase
MADAEGSPLLPPVSLSSPSGAINDRMALELEIPLRFLGPGDYAAEIYADGRGADSRPDEYDMRTFLVCAADTLHARLARAGGWVVSLKPVPPGSSLPRYR